MDSARRVTPILQAAMEGYASRLCLFLGAQYGTTSIVTFAYCCFLGPWLGPRLSLPTQPIQTSEHLFL